MRENFSLRLGTCRRRSSSRLLALFVGPAASNPAHPRPRGLARAQSRAPVVPGTPGASSPFAFTSESAVSPAILSPSPLSVPHRSQSSSATAPRLVPSVPPVTSSADIPKAVLRVWGLRQARSWEGKAQGKGGPASGHDALPDPRPPRPQPPSGALGAQHPGGMA